MPYSTVWLKEIVMYGIGVTDKSSLFHCPLLEILFLLLSQLLLLLKLQNLVNGNLSKWGVFLFLCILDMYHTTSIAIIITSDTATIQCNRAYLDHPNAMTFGWHLGRMVHSWSQKDKSISTQYHISCVPLSPSVLRTVIEHLRWY